jgi:hypothetical protein
MFVLKVAAGLLVINAYVAKLGRKGTCQIDWTHRLRYLERPGNRPAGIVKVAINYENALPVTNMSLGQP